MIRRDDDLLSRLARCVRCGSTRSPLECRARFCRQDPAEDCLYEDPNTAPSWAPAMHGDEKMDYIAREMLKAAALSIQGERPALTDSVPDVQDGLFALSVPTEPGNILGPCEVLLRDLCWEEALRAAAGLSMLFINLPGFSSIPCRVEHVAVSPIADGDQDPPVLRCPTTAFSSGVCCGSGGFAPTITLDPDELPSEGES